MPLGFRLRVKKAPSGRNRTTQRAIEILGRRFEGVMRADLKGAFATFASRVDYAKVAAAFRSGDWRKVFATMPIDNVAPLFTDAMEGSGRAMVRASEIEGDRFASMDLPAGGRAVPDSLTVGINNPKVREYIGTRTGELVQGVTADLQNNVQVAVAAGVAGKMSPREVATLIRDGLPLNNRQQSSLARYRTALSQTDMPPGRQGELVDRMRNALTDERATTIARTESQMAIGAGQRATWDEALDQGLIDDTSVKVWSCEAEPCELCAPMEGVSVPLNQPFVLPNGDEVDGPPGHVNCRCAYALEPRGEV